MLFRGIAIIYSLNKEQLFIICNYGDERKNRNLIFWGAGEKRKRHPLHRDSRQFTVNLKARVSAGSQVLRGGYCTF